MPLPRLELPHDRETFGEDDEDEEEVNDVHAQGDVEGREDGSGEADEEGAQDWTESDAGEEESADDREDARARTGVGAVGKVGVRRCCGGTGGMLVKREDGGRATHDMPPRRPSKAGPTIRKR